MDDFSEFLSAIPQIEKRLDYIFEDKQILTQAFVHRSFPNESGNPSLECNERLEFLGDAVLDLYVSNFLFSHFPNADEGILSKQKAHLICQKHCSKLMDQLGLVQYLLVAKGQKDLTGKAKISLSSDLFEAIVGAIFVDGGCPAAEKFLTFHFSEDFQAITESPPQNAKAQLQEWLAKRGSSPPVYITESIEGPPHCCQFTISVIVEGKERGTASGFSKREAEEKAAKQALQQLEKL
jgi:ribonuclease-3